jgi:cell division protein FtsW
MKLLKSIKTTFMDMDKTILFVSLILIVFGTLNIVTASSREAAVNLNQSIYYYFFKHTIILLISIVCFFVLIHIKTSNYGKLVIWVFMAVLGFNLFLVLKGVSTRGAQNWIDLGFFKLQPSELAKPTLIVCLSLLFEKYYKKLKDINVKHDMMIWKILFVGLIFPVIVFLQKDLGTAIILLGVFIFLFLFSPISKREKINVSMIVIVIGIIAAFCFLSITGYLLSKAQMSRFNYYNPCSKYSSTGYQVCNAFIAINNGGLTGVGLGKSTQKYSYIPEPHTDMVFSIIAEENGVIICSLIFIAYLIILFRILKLSMRTKKISHRYMCLGFATYFFLHIFINLGGLFGLIPLTGVPLPFLSYGGSFTISLFASLAVVERIHIEMRNEKTKI